MKQTIVAIGLLFMSINLFAQTDSLKMETLKEEYVSLGEQLQQAQSIYNLYRSDSLLVQSKQDSLLRGLYYKTVDKKEARKGLEDCEAVSQFLAYKMKGILNQAGLIQDRRKVIEKEYVSLVN
jgi:hypothetical protein